MKILIAKNYQALSTLAASIVIKEVTQKPRLVLGLPTGHTPEGMYKVLIEAFKKKKVDFEKITTFNLDEYLGLKTKNKHSYHFFMRKHLFSKVNIAQKNIYLPNEEAKNLENECANYEKLINKKNIDLLILGIGHDGHIGFNEPGSSFTSKTRIVQLSPATRKANSQYFGSDKQVPKKAITMGLGTIMKAKKILLLATGTDKADVIKKALTGKISIKIPASILQRHKNLIVIIDQEASKKL